MKMKKLLTTVFLAGICALVMMIVIPSRVMAVEPVTLPIEVYGEDVISVVLPAISEDGNSPFDFIIDPQGLIYETDAARYGGGRVEEGATILFHNHDEGEYDFSKRSDRLVVRNQSNVPVIVTITASVDDLGEINVVGNTDFGDSEDCSMYLAIVDDEGNEQPVSENGEVSVTIEMREAPDNAYVYRIDEENGSYSYEFSTDPENIDFDSYSFGLIAYCNPNGNWQDISVHPRVKVTWKVEPVLSEDVIEENDESEDDIDDVEEIDTSESNAEEKTDEEQESTEEVVNKDENDSDDSISDNSSENRDEESVITNTNTDTEDELNPDSDTNSDDKENNETDPGDSQSEDDSEIGDKEDLNDTDIN